MPGTFQQSGIDRSLSWMVLVMIVSAFVFVMILGMDGVQKNAKRVAEEQPVAAPPQVFEIGN
ncbi:hypothetical protein SAMN05421753_10270 [Planctomicrobium piriforme]|uniref:Uncharacterized protein n=2 Tax=Planctomicrobium piriforme TaxID=1576369 RepID=A0A1I3C4H3_9PLAN|nr:hypothetical protein SAMN05421753_10270 [Planctomicrobium piriforme]